MEETLVVTGLGGEKVLDGSLRIGGAKNAALPMLAATLLFETRVTLTNIPTIADIRRSVELLKSLGAEVVYDEDEGVITVDARDVTSGALDSDIAKRMRASVIFTGPLLARFGSVTFPHPGGCVIGKRPIDMFLENFRHMGAVAKRGEEAYTITTKKESLAGRNIFFKMPTVTGTETLLMAAVLAEGTTVLRNAAMEPEVSALAEFLSQHGARINGIGTPTLTIEGGKLLSQDKGTSTAVIPDRLEAGSYLVLGALCAKHLTLTHCNPEHLQALIHMLVQSGVPIEHTRDSIHIKGNTKPNAAFEAFDIKTHEYPGFPTDLQAPTVVFLTQATGEARVFETIFEGRLHYTEDLNRMHADIELLDQHRAIVRGPSRLKAKTLKSPDIRAGLAFVIAAAVAEGKSEIHDVYYIDRGYEYIEEKLSGIGLAVERREE